MDAFVKMRQFLMANVEVVSRMNVLEKRQFTTDAKVDAILERLDTFAPPAQGVFYDGQLWDAHVFMEKLIGSARKSMTTGRQSRRWTCLQRSATVLM